VWKKGQNANAEKEKDEKKKIQFCFMISACCLVAFYKA
jgi:hypothetical protein